MMRLILNNVNMDFVTTKFSDGAISVKLNSPAPRHVERANIVVVSEGKLNDELFTIASMVDIVRSINPRAIITLDLPYCPYARQDRRMVRHDAFSLKVYAAMLNSLKLDRVITIDAHSDVGPSLIDNNVNIPQDFIFGSSTAVDSIKGWADVIVAPDAGAAKKTLKAAKVLGFDPNLILYMEKVRDVTNGNITGSRILGDTSHLCDFDALIVDDLCDGGGTFIQAAQSLYDAGATSVGLFVTHGIFSRGYQPLLDAGIDRIWTTDSITTGNPEHKQVTVFKSRHITNEYFLRQEA